MKINELLNEAVVDPHKNIEKLLTTRFYVKSNINSKNKNIKPYTIRGDGLVDVIANVRSIAAKFTTASPALKLPIKFGIVDGHFDISNGELRTLRGCPSFVRGDFRCIDNKLTNLIGGPEEVDGDYRCFKNPLTSLEGLPKIIRGSIGLPYFRELPLLKLILVSGLTHIILNDPNVKSRGPDSGDLDHLTQIEDILNKYLGNGQKGAIQCAAELSKAGFKGNARL